MAWSSSVAVVAVAVAAAGGGIVLGREGLTSSKFEYAARILLSPATWSGALVACGSAGRSA